MGFNELGYRNTTRGLQTPNIDALAANGVTLSRYYTTPLCSPSRSSLMTGIYNHRIGTQANVIYWGACGACTSGPQHRIWASSSHQATL